MRIQATTFDKIVDLKTEAGIIETVKFIKLYFYKRLPFLSRILNEYSEIIPIKGEHLAYARFIPDNLKFNLYINFEKLDGGYYNIINISSKLGIKNSHLEELRYLLFYDLNSKEVLEHPFINKTLSEISTVCGNSIENIVKLINVEKLDKQNFKNYSFMFLGMVVFHELLHCVQKHFIRPDIKEFDKISHKLTNIILDGHINNWFMNALDYKTAKIYNNEIKNEICDLKDEVKNIGGIFYDDLGKIAKEYKKIEIDINDNNFEAAETLLNKFSPLYEDIKERKKEIAKIIENTIANKENKNNSDSTELQSRPIDIFIDLIEIYEENGSNFIGKYGKNQNMDTGSAEVDSNQSTPYSGNHKKSKANIDELSEKELEEQNIEAEELIKAIITDIFNRIGRGDENKYERELIEELMKEKNILNFIEFERLLKSFSADKKEKSYKRPHRSREWPGGILVKSTIQKNEGKKHIIIGIDCSGSISDLEIKKFIGIVQAFLRDNEKRVIVDIVFWSSCKIDPENNGMFLRLEDLKSYDKDEYKNILKGGIYSSGGTEIERLFNFIDEFDFDKYSFKAKSDIIIEEQCSLVVITDGAIGYATLPKSVSNIYFVLSRNSFGRIKSLWKNDENVDKIKKIIEISVKKDEKVEIIKEAKL